jgi:hypothetical protein
MEVDQFDKTEELRFEVIMLISKICSSKKLNINEKNIILSKAIAAANE